MSSGPSARLFLVRHGRVHNPDEVAYGHLPRYRIGDEGQAQALRAAAWLAPLGVMAIYVSPLLRARQTARVIRAACGNPPMHTNRRLRESELARFWQGMPWQQIAVAHPELFATFESAPSTITTGETMTAMAARMRSACLTAARRYPGGTLVLVSHRDPILALRLQAEGRSHDDLNQTTCQPGSISEFTVEDGRVRFVGYTEP